jgi:tRNA (guanine-N7-)-methyltransferase
MELEVGCGTGVFAIEYCRGNPWVRYVAIEKRSKYAREALARAERAGASNLRVIEGDATLELDRLFAPMSLDVVRIHFPDPWWKRAHHRRVVIRPDTAHTYLAKLKVGGLLDFRTDVPARAVEFLAALEGAGFVNPLGAGAFHPDDATEVRTARERRLIAAGQPVYRARLRRAA